jgi:microsomal dipeptidase-like Zn-dependent dipeptidase
MIGRKVRVTPEAESLHRGSLVVDCHSHFLINGYLFRRRFDGKHSRPLVWNPFQNSLDLDSAVAGGVGALAFTTYVPGRPLPIASDRVTDRLMDRYFEIVAECGDRVVHCTTAAQIRDAAAAGKLAGFLAIEGGHVLRGRLETLEHFASRGVRMLTLTHFLSNEICDGTASPWRPHKGLSPFGREAVRAMEQLGVLVDVAHCTQDAMEQVIAAASRPVVYSHGGLRRYRDLERNLTDDQVRSIAETGGLVGIIFFWRYLGSSGNDIRAVARQCRDVAEMVGPQHLCLGSDMDGTTYLPPGFVDASDWPQVTQALLDEGFHNDEIRGILGENFLRVLGLAEG